MSVSRPLASWPELLCGPMLRRVTLRSVSVFVALKASCAVELAVYDKPAPAAGDTPLMTGSANTLPFGRNLHVAVVTVELRDGQADLTPNKLYGYDVRFSGLPGTTGARTLADLGLLSGPNELGYGDGKLPAFALPPGLADFRLVHGSCRKPHGGGQDMLAALDYLIQSTHEDPLKRPHQLLLTGDQIYADDVALPLLATLMATARDLLGWSSPEQIPFSTREARAKPEDASVRPGPERESFIKRETKLTSDAVDGHLMFLGEFFAMYLMAWSDALWPRAPQQDGNPFDIAIVEDMHLPEDLSKKDRKDLLKKFWWQREYVLSYARSLPRVRRALANVPTYMIFDDHEVTDDWFLHRQWNEAVRNNPPGQRIMRNALLAYALFQDWGNQPQVYVAGLGKNLFDALRFQPGAGVPPHPDKPGCL